MTTKQKLVLIALWPLVALGVYLWFPTGATSDSVTETGSSFGWTLVAAALYVVNFVIAWYHRGSWPMTLGRSMFWAVFAYVCISHLVDLFGENREVAWQILGDAGPGDPALIEFLRGQLFAWGVALAMAATCIGVGFEPRENGDAPKSSG